MKKLLVVLICVLGLTGCSSTTSNEEVSEAPKEVIEVNEMENIEKLTNEVVTYMTNIKNSYEEKLLESEEDAKKYIDNVYRGPAIGEKKNKIENVEVSSELGKELKIKLKSTWISFVNILMEKSSDDTDTESIDRSIETIKDNIEYIQSNL